MFFTYTISKSLRGLMVFLGVVNFCHQSMVKCTVVVDHSLTSTGNYLLDGFIAAITSLKSDFCVCSIGLHCVNSPSVVLSSYESFKSCDYCVSSCDACSFSNSSESSKFWGCDKSLRMTHGIQVFPTCYKLGEFSTIILSLLLIPCSLSLT